jgi:hypothetical protein
VQTPRYLPCPAGRAETVIGRSRPACGAAKKERFAPTFLLAASHAMRAPSSAFTR